jgi:hypothetical protein
MKRITLREHIGSRHARSLTVAARIAQEIEETQRQGECLLIDCEGIDVEPQFLAVLLAAAKSDKICFCGLPQELQREVRLAKGEQ